LVAYPSGISFGDTAPDAGPNHRMALYESSNGYYFYGLGLCTGTNIATGIGFYASTGNTVPSGTGSGAGPQMLFSEAGRLGIGIVNPTQRLHVVGNILCSGTISGTTKSFDIKHPDPSKQDYRLRHWCVESDKPGGMVMYRKQITATKASTIIINMPDWFKHLTKNVIIFCSPYEHFGNAWGKYIDNNIIEIHTSKGGKYNILITCDRADHCAVNECPQEVEYIPEEPEIDNDNGMPPQ